jgi:hypothetical protein
MSAFMCSDKHISALACYAAQHDVCRYVGRAEELAKLLHKSNALSLTARYGDPDDPPFEFHFVETRNLPLINVIKAAHCFEYQACEYDGWEKSEAKRVIESIVSNATVSLPGYDDAPWGSPV